jgi:hypothetical protein
MSASIVQECFVFKLSQKSTKSRLEHRSSILHLALPHHSNYLRHQLCGLKFEHSEIFATEKVD